MVFLHAFYVFFWYFSEVITIPLSPPFEKEKGVVLHG